MSMFNEYLFTFQISSSDSVVSWMAGLLYLPRIFVYHVEKNKKIITQFLKLWKENCFIIS